MGCALLLWPQSTPVMETRDRQRTSLQVPSRCRSAMCSHRVCRTTNATRSEPPMITELQITSRRRFMALAGMTTAVACILPRNSLLKS